MALQLKITVTGFNRATHILSLDDTTGVYNNPANLGGYGAPNPERNEFALVISSIRVMNDLEDVQFGADPLTDASFTFEVAVDQVSNIRLCAIPFESTPLDIQALALGYVFYHVNDDLVYKVVDAGNGIKELVTTTDVFANALHSSVALPYLVKSYAENRRIDFWCEEVVSCSGIPSQEYIDNLKVLEAMECHFDELFYLKADQVALFSGKISKAPAVEDSE